MNPPSEITTTTPTQIDFSPEKQELLVAYPKSPDLKINNSDLKLELKDFKKATKNEPSIPHIATLLSLWAVFFTAQFQDFWILKARDLFVGFTVLTLVLTLLSVRPIFIFLAQLLTGIDWVKKRFPKLGRWHHKNETNPEAKADSIIKMSCR